MNFKLRTTDGVTYNLITKYREWELDPNFIEFVWGERRGVLIIPKSRISSIESY